MATILYIDDDPSSVAPVLEDTLARAGHTSIGARDVSDALERLSRGGVDLVISCVTGPVAPERLERAVDQALEIARLRRENDALRREVGGRSGDGPRHGVVTLETLNVEAAERQLVYRALDAAAGNRTRAAALLGMSVRTLRNKLRAYGEAARTPPGTLAERA